jgi:glyoxylase-like metal-dependent hydrolase (beta-lactamase superfamily II)
MPAHKISSVKSLSATTLLALSILWPAARASAQRITDPIVPQNMVKKVSDHVSLIMSFPNIALVVGNRATLVVDTGMGARNGAVVYGEAQKLSKNQTMYLTTTHFHAEHSAGASAFPPSVLLIRNRAQQEEMVQSGDAFVKMFASRNQQFKDLLADYKDRKPDIIFDKDMTLDLGGVTVRFFYLGPAHTVGDELIDVEPDSALIPGDVVQNKQTPNATTVKGWIAVLDQLAPMNFKYVVPDHGPLGDGSLIPQERAFLVAVQTRSLELKKSGKSEDDAVKMVTDEFKAKYPDWEGINGVGNDVRRVYAEN